MSARSFVLLVVLAAICAEFHLTNAFEYVKDPGTELKQTYDPKNRTLVLRWEWSLSGSQVLNQATIKRYKTKDRDNTDKDIGYVYSDGTHHTDNAYFNLSGQAGTFGGINGYIELTINDINNQGNNKDNSKVDVLVADYTYECTVTIRTENSPYIETTNLIVYVLPGKPVLQLHPDNPVFCQGDTINITCNGVTGHPTLTNLAFLKNDSSIGMLNVTTSGNYTKTVLSHALTQPGTFTYSCKASNAGGSSPTSNVATITVKDPPIISSCANKTVLEKTNLTMTCNVSGSLPLTISWFKGNNNTVLPSGKSLNIATVSRADSGMYRFTAKNGGECPTASKIVYLDVQSLPGTPVLQLHPDKLVFCQGDTINITCNGVIGHPTLTNLAFLKNDSAINNVTTSSNYTKAIISHALTQPGTFTYSCKATNDAGSSPTSNVVTITVKDPPVITNCTNKTVVEKDNLVWTCDANGSQPLNISWFKGDTSAVIKSGKSLNIAAVNRTNSGMYRLTASNGGECPTAKATVYLDVQYKPEQLSVDMAQNGFIDINKTDTINITCSAKGNPEPYYHWVFDGKPLSSLRNDTITISNAAKGNAGKYTCTAVNAVGNETINVTVRVHYIEEATCNANPNPVKENESLVLNCSAAGYPPVNYTWTLPTIAKVLNQPIVNETATTSLNGVNMTCTAMNSRGSKTCTKTITVHYKPRNVQVVPASVPALEINGTFSLTCNASSNPDGSYTWSLNGVTLVGKTNRVLTKDNITSQDAGEYACTVTNKEGSGSSNKVTINVNYIGEATCDAKPNPVNENENFALICSAAGYPAVNYTWTLPGSAVYQQNTTVNATQSLNGVDMTCKAMNSRGNKTCIKTITVHYKPRNVQVVPASVPALDINGSFSLTCNASSNPDGSYTWSLNGVTLDGETNRVLTKDNITSQDAGEYACTVTNKEGNGTSNKVTINVNYIGEATCDAKPNPVSENENLKLSCSAAGYPAVNYTWTLPTIVLNQPIVNETATTSLNGVNMTCKAMNSLGSKICTKTITVHYKPRNVQVVPASVPALDINGSFNLTCNASSNPDGSYTWSKNGVTLVDKTNRVLTKDNIKPNDTGVYTCTVANKEGNGTSNKVTINVNYAPKMQKCVPVLRLSDNTTFEFNCEKPNGFPTPNYTTLFNGSRYNASINITIDRVTKALNRLVIQCSASNMLGSDSCNTTLIVEYAPKMQQCNSSLELSVDASHVFNCEKPNGFPSPNYTTLFNGSSYNASINITMTKALNGLVIRCSASNSLGSDSCNTTLNVKTYQKKGSFKCTSLSWDDDMGNPSTVVFKKLLSSFTILLWKLFKRFAMRLKILSFVQGSVNVNFQIEFTANESDPLSPMKEALKNNGGVLDGYSIDPNSIQQGIYVPKPTTTAPTPAPTPAPTSEPSYPGTEAIIGIAIGCVVFVILVIILLVYCCYCKKRRDCKDDAFAENGENVVPMRGIENKGSTPSPSTYAKHGPGANGNNNAGNGDAQVDQSKKPAGSNEDEVTYAVLEYGRADNKSGDAQLAHMPSSGKQPEKYESDYAEITGVIRSSENHTENESTDNSNKNEKNPENAEKESEAEEQAKDKNQDGSTSTSQTVDNAVKNDNASGSQVNVETKGTSSSAPQYGNVSV